MIWKKNLLSVFRSVSHHLKPPALQSALTTSPPPLMSIGSRLDLTTEPFNGHRMGKAVLGNNSTMEGKVSRFGPVSGSKLV